MSILFEGGEVVETLEGDPSQHPAIPILFEAIGNLSDGFPKAAMAKLVEAAAEIAAVDEIMLEVHDPWEPKQVPR